MIFFLLILALIVFAVVGQWKLFEKAGKPGWTSLIPFYNLVVWFEIIGKPLWQILLFFVPLANIYVLITMSTGMCKSFGKTSTGHYLLAIFFYYIYIPYLGFSDEIKYVGPAEGVARTQVA